MAKWKSTPSCIWTLRDLTFCGSFVGYNVSHNSTCTHMHADLLSVFPTWPQSSSGRWGGLCCLTLMTFLSHLRIETKLLLCMVPHEVYGHYNACTDDSVQWLPLPPSTLSAGPPHVQSGSPVRSEYGFMCTCCACVLKPCMEWTTTNICNTNKLPYHLPQSYQKSLPKDKLTIWNTW